MLKFKTATVMVAILLAVGFAFPIRMAQAQASNQIAVFYLQKVMEDSKRGKDASKKLEAKYDGLRKSLDAKAKDIQKKGQDLENARQTLSEDAFIKRRDDLAKEYTTHMENAQKAGADMEKAREEAMLPLMEKVTNVVGGLAQERGYQFVFEVQNAGVFYHPKAVDITPDVIKGLDK
ncbi:MAG: OmpH family outer membrane protein [Deltaproteobacteria bacterium]|jgi:Skp family chaperone for outer membrane proteins|nr:OmpH family outer membrane protein [Deltaproteobacteria bacterium]